MEVERQGPGAPAHLEVRLGSVAAEIARKSRAAWLKALFMHSHQLDANVVDALSALQGVFGERPGADLLDEAARALQDLGEAYSAKVLAFVQAEQSGGEERGRELDLRISEYVGCLRAAAEQFAEHGGDAPAELVHSCCVRHLYREDEICRQKGASFVHALGRLRDALSKHGELESGVKLSSSRRSLGRKLRRVLHIFFAERRTHRLLRAAKYAAGAGLLLYATWQLTGTQLSGPRDARVWVRRLWGSVTQTELAAAGQADETEQAEAAQVKQAAALQRLARPTPRPRCPPPPPRPRKSPPRSGR